MKLAPSTENVELLREVADCVHQTAEGALGDAESFVSQVTAAGSGLTDGDEESLMEVARSAVSQLKSLYDVMIELAKETSDLADELDQAVKQKTFGR